jgi:hypothetical protein
MTSTTGMSATREPRTVLLQIEELSLLLLKQDVDPRDDLFDVDRLGEVVVDAELEAFDLVFNRRLGGEEDERNLGPVGHAAQTTTQLETVEVAGELRLGDDEVRSVRLELVECVGDGDGRRDAEARLAQRHLEHSQTASVPIDQEQALLRHAEQPSDTAEES